MNYIDGYIVAVPTKNKEAYRELAKEAAVIFKEHGALNLVECWGDDVPEGVQTSFPKAVQLKEDETAVFSWISWPDKATRDAGMKKVMEDPRMDKPEYREVFDGKRMIYGGFTVLVNE